MSLEKLKKGKLLVAEPCLIGDLSFNRTVILIANHDKKGTVGFIINKPLKYTINDLIPDIKASLKIYQGGPVEQENLYFIHNVPNLIPNSLEIADGIYWGGDYITTIELINSNKINKNNIRFFLGYTGWNYQQLKTEISNKTWIISRNNQGNKIIGKSISQLWKKKIVELGDEYLIWVNTPLNPTFN